MPGNLSWSSVLASGLQHCDAMQSTVKKCRYYVGGEPLDGALPASGCNTCGMNAFSFD